MEKLFLEEVHLDHHLPRHSNSLIQDHTYWCICFKSAIYAYHCLLPFEHPGPLQLLWINPASHHLQHPLEGLMVGLFHLLYRHFWLVLLLVQQVRLKDCVAF